MSLYASLFIFSSLLGLVLGWGIISRRKTKNKGEKSGCSAIYIFILTVIISNLAIPFTLIIPHSFFPLFTGNKMEVPIVFEEMHYDTVKDSDGHEREVAMFTPIVEIELDNGRKLERKLDYSSGDRAKIGSNITIYYDAKNDKVLTLGIISVATKLVAWLTCIWLLALLWAGYNYAIGKPTARPKNILGILGLKLIIPLMMLGFTLGLLSYLYKRWILLENPDDHPDWLPFLVLFFVGGMLVGIWAYSSAIFGSKDQNAVKRT
ncbi:MULTISPECIES: hypothetical protein [Zobellia]|uniref:Conserved hypothetical membrane protein n=1 Tax=Zobellia galactanivorans (strain DSM 12802 / CCUG 47099 / CIP 106680 / NCIMB 13871 / Dsij) TaxID=63186 RepID=G0L0X4_ZOBGA|nr:MULTISPECIES: hypothetical protein [Zobellia]CAZ94523.1 Conserved hypothetical membrane protein [Zobellia galactanivorans]